MPQNAFHICVIGAEVNNIEQQQILSGIIQEAQSKNADIIVISNLYNHLEKERTGCADNQVYELISDIKADAFIILSESFVNQAVRQKIHDLLAKRTDIPVIMTGTPLPEFEPELFPCISTSDKKDMEAIVDKLIEENGFTRISFLTGPLSLETSRNRVEGYRSSLEKHNIPYDETVVYEGNFWYNSGEELAKKYISGEIPYPQALVCANDYMAFGVLDAFSASGTDITQHLALVGYEYIPERSLHKPILTTYQRNRKALGAEAVDILLKKLNNIEKELPPEPPSGVFIAGQSCLCPDLCDDELQEELCTLRSKNQYAFWNLKSDMESNLTGCRNYDEFISVMGEELFIIRNAEDVVLCLFENWFKENEKHSDTLICRNVNKYARRDDIVLKESELHILVEHFRDMSVLYVNPVFFKERLLGYCVVMYKTPDTYDNTYRYWLKSISNGLEFLRLKTDINFLMQCSTLSSAYDGLTGLFNKEGLRTAFQLMKNSDKSVGLTAVAVRFTGSNDIFTSEVSSKETINNILAAARIIKRFCENSGIAGRISESELILIHPMASLKTELLVDAVYSELLFSKDNSQKINPDRFLFCGTLFQDDNIGFDNILENIINYFNTEQEILKEHLNLPHYKELRNIRREILLYPYRKYSLDEVSGSLNLNQNYFNRIYKQFYGTTFNQEQIYSRIRYAKHLLLNTVCSVSDIAEKCGYTDSKYFIKQFTSTTGLSPKQYRSAIKYFFE